MTSTPETAALPDDIDALKALYVAETERLRHQVEYLQEQLNLLLHKRFGRSSEQTPAHQLGLFNEAEVEVAGSDEGGEAAGEPETIEVPAHTRGKRAPLPAHLPRVEILHDLPEADKVCPCGCTLTRIRDERTEQLDLVPAKIQVLCHIYPVYACKGCEETVRQAKAEPQPIPKSQASPGLLAFIATQKFVDGVPLHRQEAQFRRIGFELDRGTSARWMIRAGGDLIPPLLRRFDDTLLEYGYQQMDETRIQVLKEAGRAAESQSYIWVQRGGPPDRPVVRYHYYPTRAHTVPLGLLDGFEGYLQADGYEAYAVAVARHPGITLVGCFAHARRKFDEAVKAQKTPKPGKAHQGLAYIRRLYAIEKRLREGHASAEEIYRARQEQAKPVLEEIRAWLDRSLPQVPPKSLLGKALGYLHHQWDKLTRYLDDGRLDIDNNAVERAIRPFVIGRKNWLFADTPQGATASANLYSLIETAKLSGHEPYHYLRHVFTELPKATTLEQVDALLPWNLDARKLTRS